MSRIIVELRGVTKIYPGVVPVKALDNVNMKIEAGEFVAIMGSSGSGKTTLLNMIGCMDRPTSGEVIIDGVNTRNPSEKELSRLRAEKIGFVFQTYNLISTLTCLENVELPMHLTGKGKGRDITRRAAMLLHLLGLGDRLHHRPNQLSGGERQRVAIARALANNSEIILCDEPTGNLDSVTGGKIVSLIKYIGRLTGATVIVVTHDRDVALKADRILYMRDGRVFEREESRVGVEKQMLYEVTEIMARSLPLIKEIISPSKYEEVKKDLLEVLEKLEDERDVF